MGRRVLLLDIPVRPAPGACHAKGEIDSIALLQPRAARPNRRSAFPHMARLNFLSSLFSMTDEQAMWRVQTQDDHLAFAHLVGRWEAPIRRLCARLTGDPHRADDLKQETFARVFEKRKSFQPNARFSTWLWRIALNLCYDELRRINRRGESPLAVDENEGGGLGQFTTESPAPDFQLAAQ